jgi:CRP-like cAMP-binding protein
MENYFPSFTDTNHKPNTLMEIKHSSAIKQQQKENSFKRTSTLNSKRIQLTDDEKREKEEKQFKELTDIISKHQRNSQENQTILNYMLTLKDLCQMIKQFHDNFYGMMLNLSIEMKYEYYGRGRILFRTGETGDKFYIILRGEVAILDPQVKRFDMSEEEYIIYLCRLKQYQENDLLERCIKMNMGIYTIINEDFETWLRDLKDAYLNSVDQLLRKKEEIYNSVLNEITTTLINIENKKNEASQPVQRGSFRISILKQEENQQKQRISIEQYISRLYPSQYSTTLNRKNVQLYVYNKVNSLRKGNTFGELALEENSGKRSATIIATEESHLGTLNKRSFEVCLKEMNDKMRKLNITFLLSSPLFTNVNKSGFTKSIFNSFAFEKYTRNFNLIDIDSEPNSLFILKEGEYELKMKRSLSEINQMILKLGGRIMNEKVEIELMNGS